MGLYEQIRDIAKMKGYSINKLEQELGFARSSINKFNKNKPSIDKLRQIADFLGVSVEYLLTGKDTCNGGLTEMEQDVLQLFRQLPKDAQFDFRGQLKGYVMATAEKQATKEDAG